MCAASRACRISDFSQSVCVAAFVGLLWWHTAKIFYITLHLLHWVFFFYIVVAILVLVVLTKLIAGIWECSDRNQTGQET